MKVLVLVYELFALGDVVRLEEQIQVLLQLLQHILQSLVYFLGLLRGRLFNLLLQLEHIGHELAVLNGALIVNVDALHLHLHTQILHTM